MGKSISKGYEYRETQGGPLKLGTHYFDGSGGIMYKRKAIEKWIEFGE